MAREPEPAGEAAANKQELFRSRGPVRGVGGHLPFPGCGRTDPAFLRGKTRHKLSGLSREGAGPGPPDLPGPDSAPSRAVPELPLSPEPEPGLRARGSSLARALSARPEPGFLVEGFRSPVAQLTGLLSCYREKSALVRLQPGPC